VTESEVKAGLNGTNGFGMPLLGFPKIALPGMFGEFSEQGVARAREGCEKIKTASEEMTAAFANLDRTLDELVTAHHGVRPVEQGEGDSFVVAFTGTSEAVACALALQRAPLAPIRLRIGVHTGEVQLRDEGNYIGPAINRAARLRELAHGGQTVLSGTTTDLVADLLPDGAWLNDLGTHPLRDLPRPERVVQLCHPDICNEFPPLRVREAVAVRRHEGKPADCVGDQEEGPPSLVLGGVGPFVFPQDDGSRAIVTPHELVRRAPRRVMNRVPDHHRGASHMCDERIAQELDRVAPALGSRAERHRHRADGQAEQRVRRRPDLAEYAHSTLDRAASERS